MEKLNVEIKVNGLEFKGELGDNKEAQELFSKLIGGVFTNIGESPISNVSAPNQQEVPKGVVTSPVVEVEPDVDTKEVVEAIRESLASDSKPNNEDEEKYTFKDIVELAQEMSKDMHKETTDHTTRREPTGKRKLLMGQCECGEKHFLWIYDNGKEHTFNCRKCGKEHTADYNKLIKANIRCRNCGNEAYAFTNSRVALEATCRNCESPIDLAYHEAHKCMESLN